MQNAWLFSFTEMWSCYLVFRVLNKIVDWYLVLKITHHFRIHKAQDSNTEFHCYQHHWQVQELKCMKIRYNLPNKIECSNWQQWLTGCWQHYSFAMVDIDSRWVARLLSQTYFNTMLDFVLRWYPHRSIFFKYRTFICRKKFWNVLKISSL